MQRTRLSCGTSSLASFGRLATTVALVGVTSTMAAANVGINVWTSSTSFHHSRTGVPDQDQKRVGLPNSGSCYCAPTSYVNMMIYISNHGYPQVEPGPGVYSTYENYYPVTDLLEELGAEASISPGGPDPNDPDCNGNDGQGEGGGDGECENLFCGGSVTNVHNAFVANGYYGAAEDDLVFIAKSLDPQAPATSFLSLAQLAYDGSILEICYGRYAPVGESEGGTTIYKRGGGHCVTMNGIHREGTDMTISVRDPAQDDGDIFGPSPYVSKIYDITTLAVLTTGDDPDEGPIVNTEWKLLPAIDEPHEDGKKRLIDGYFAIRPKTGVFWKDQDLINELPLAGGFGGADPIPHPTPLAPILDLVSDEHDIGWFVLTGGGSGAGQLLKINQIENTETPLGTTLAKQMALSRFDELYLISESPASIERRDAAGAVLGSASIAGLPKAIACDDSFGFVYVVVPGSSGFGGSIIGYPRSLGADGASVKTWPIASTVQLGLPGQTTLRAMVNPKNGMLYVASAELDTVVGFNLPFVPRGPVAGTPMGVSFAKLTGIDFDDAGRMYCVDEGHVEVFQQSSAGAWSQVSSGAFAGVEVGTTVRISKSRSNYDPAIHETAAWANIDAEDLEPLGSDVPDCLGDLNGDGVIDAADLAVLLGQWGNAGIADLDQSGTVDAGDLARLLGAWGTC